MAHDSAGPVLLTTQEYERIDDAVSAGRPVSAADTRRIFLAYRSAAAALILQQDRLTVLEVSRDTAVKRNIECAAALELADHYIGEVVDATYQEYYKDCTVTDKTQAFVKRTFGGVARTVLSLIRRNMNPK